MIIIEVQHMKKSQFSYINISWFVIISNLVLKDEDMSEPSELHQGGGGSSPAPAEPAAASTTSRYLQGSLKFRLTWIPSPPPTPFLQRIFPSWIIFRVFFSIFQVSQPPNYFFF